jgi:hypothetical protein
MWCGRTTERGAKSLHAEVLVKESEREGEREIERERGRERAMAANKSTSHLGTYT